MKVIRVQGVRNVTLEKPTGQRVRNTYASWPHVCTGNSLLTIFLAACTTAQWRNMV